MKKAAAAGALVVLLAVALFFGRRYLIEHALSSNAPIAGVGGRLLRGRTVEERGKIHPGMAAKELLAALGQPTYRFGEPGRSVYVRWQYEYADGKLLITLGDGYIVEIDTTLK